MRYFKENHEVAGLTSSKFYMTAEDAVCTSREKAEKYTQYSVTEFTAPVWQLCESRHDNPIANMGGLFPRCLMNPMDTDSLYLQLKSKLQAVYSFPDTVFCVATGMSTALLALVNACASLDLRLCVLHFDVVHECYKAQWVYNPYWEDKFDRQCYYDDSDGVIRVVRK